MNDLLMVTSPKIQEALHEEIVNTSTVESDFSSTPPQYSEEEKAAFLKSLADYQKTHKIMRPGQKKFRSKLSHLTPKKKKRKK